MGNSIFLRYRNQLLALVGLLGLLSTLYFIKQSDAFRQHPDELSMAITLDLILTFPLVYFFLIRKTTISKLSLIPVFVLGVVIAHFLIPKEQQGILTLVKTFIVPALELTVMAIIFTKIRRARQEFSQGVSRDFYDRVNAACREVFGERVAYIFATEFTVIYFAFFSWKRRPLEADEFSYHKQSAAQSILYGLLLAVFAETWMIHLLLSQWSELAAWIATILSIYTGIQVLGIAKSLSKRPVHVEEHHLYLRFGLFSEAQIPLKNILTLEQYHFKDDDQHIKKISPFSSVDSPNLLLRLDQLTTFRGLYGIKHSYKEIGFYLDEPESFLAYLKTKNNEEV
ncbi:MAG: hypothetical protein EP338_08270 [Bacteroidetes bacterium]|nr:MAG: hypothetical protein EP338_08270 [Bacteroidota bacterium]